MTRMGKIDFGGILKEASLAYVPEATIGDYVIVHVGFAISRLDEAEAHKVFEYLREMEELSDLETPRPPAKAGGTATVQDVGTGAQDGSRITPPPLTKG